MIGTRAVIRKALPSKSRIIPCTPQPAKVVSFRNRKAIHRRAATNQLLQAGARAITDGTPQSAPARLRLKSPRRVARRNETCRSADELCLGRLLASYRIGRRR